MEIVSRCSYAVSEQESNGYLLIAASGGLNQQSTGISDAVVVAGILNATLVVPELDHNPYWKDDSDFVNIFYVDWFISYLAKDVTIVKRVPDKFMRSMEKPPYTMPVNTDNFEGPPTEDLPTIDDDLQKLRCRANFHALRFTKPIQELGQKLVLKMREKATRFIAVHLRLDPDMLAFSGCYFGGGDKERFELGEIRKQWETLPEIDSVAERRGGKCPLTPHEVGLMLRALEMLANEYLKPFLPHSSCLAAIDYIVCNKSDVFITNNKGNMAKILAGRSIYCNTLCLGTDFVLVLVVGIERRYMGHKRTIRPNAKRLSPLLMERDRMDWDNFAKKVRAVQRGFMGEPDEMRAGRCEFHVYPYSCICEKPASDIGGNESGGHHSQQFEEDQGLRKRSNEEEEPVFGAKKAEHEQVFPKRTGTKNATPLISNCFIFIGIIQS
ncbi:hypothetical protein F3Y22_tig00002890pilonHSYRG00008 [Hibiscus syriacus]|uniref:O-fucosyltransferase family protein n=1 Tax=Hibiscus syriacus TaxID=106335 RepID=A0A6A3CMQ9_HIBSY|nr:hypothetical protein F3Y22_tig00002890pilonHSYRG00008 [Hibiscus syriacus]